MKYLPFLLLILAGSSLIVQQPEYTIQIKDDLSEEIGIEDLQGRSEYELLLTADPKTGSIPLNIKQEELRFAKTLVEETKNLRTQELNIAAFGPFNVGGRTRAVAFDIRNEEVILAGGVSGGIWKSINGGQTWNRVSNPENRNSVTCLVQDTREGKEDTWYHGTGELRGNSARAPGGSGPYRGNGIYKSTDNGETWNVISSTVDSTPNVFNSQFQYIWGIEVNEQNLVEDEILVAAYGGILQSLDGGDTWDVKLGQQLYGLSDDANLNDEDASFYTSIRQANNGVYFATLSTETSSDTVSPEAGIYVSADGEIWHNINPFTEESRFRRVEIGVSESNPFAVYFLIDPAFILKYNLQSVNENGASGFFEDTKKLPPFEQELGSYDSQGSYNMMIRVHPEDENIVYLGGTNLYKSTDGFSTEENIRWIGGYTPEGGSGSYPNHHPDQHDLLFYPSNPEKLLSASDGGLIVTDDARDSVRWRSINNGFLTSQFFTIAQSQEANDPIMLGGMQDNGTDLTDANGLTDWVDVIGGDGGYAATTREKALWYTSFQRGQVYRLTLNDDYNLTSFARVDPEDLVTQAGGAPYLFINPFILDPSNQNRMFLAGGSHLYFHENVSQIPSGSQEPTSLGWNRVTEDNLFVGSMSALEMSRNGEVLFFGSAGGQLFRLDNANDFISFDVVDITSPLFPENSFISSISANPADRNHLLVTLSNYNIPSVFESLDGGETFSDVSGNLEENPDGSGSGSSVRWGEIIPTNSGTLFLVGTSTGLYSTELLDGSSTIWTKESNDLIGSAVIAMMDYRSVDGKLAIATHGNGVFATTIDDFRPISNSAEGEPFEIARAYPNPFEVSTNINYSIPEDGIVKIDIFSTKGELVTNLLWAPQFAGSNSASWNGRTPTGASVANGIYLFRIEYDGQTKSGRVLLRR